MWTKMVLTSLMLLTLAPRMPAEFVSFTDGTFSGYNVDLAANPNGLIYSVNQLTTGGNPGDALQFSINFQGPPPGFLIRLGAINPAFAFTPSTQGAITSIDLADDHFLNITDGSNFWNHFLHATSSSWLLEQGGKFYSTAIGLPLFPGVYTHAIKHGTVASDWDEIDPLTGIINVSHPDFSASGSTIEFGVTAGAGFNTPGPSGNIDIRLDNLAIDVNYVPEPSTLALGLAGATALLWLRFQRNVLHHPRM